MTNSDAPAIAPGPARESGFSPSLQEVGERVRQRRRERGLSLRELAGHAGLSSSFLSLVERGECSLSLTSLFAISAALSITPADLLDSSHTAEPAPQEFALWRAAAAAARPTMSVGEREYYRLPTAFDGQELDALYVRIHPTSTIAPLATHEGEEFAYVVRGSMWLRLRDHELVLGEGDGVHFSSGTPHTIANLTSEPVDAIWVSTHSAPHEHGLDVSPTTRTVKP
ncbi:helix-turn-helix domain-containing protein [Gryllotalpicola ginsengisoli]|uniref:helix-turn-helix domain-containing protein n=1 Tax=Gryllotalpicola ginsengisoli TaxID=444608 RepID=UPI0003B64A68|nr:XRE family transcriptional regulator [Gryllotalpicola ginsengisoli]